MNSTNIYKPIPFNTEMVQAVLAGRKSQTRRVTVDWDQHKPKFIISSQGMYGDKYPKPSKYMAHFRYPEESTDSVGLVTPIQPGDILWVREAFHKAEENEYGVKHIYKADVLPALLSQHKFKPSIHMPKEAARIFLKVINVRCERLQDISREDCKNEGIKFREYPRKGLKNYYNYLTKSYAQPSYGRISPSHSFQTLWDSINAKKHPWSSNPWVWVYDFERIEKPENFN